MFRIALCDDDSNSIEILEKHFDKLNNYSLEYDVYFRADELYSHKLKNNLVYDIYILDIEMHGMNGLELAKKLRTNDPNAVIIFLTNICKFFDRTFIRVFYKSDKRSNCIFSIFYTIKK